MKYLLISLGLVVLLAMPAAGQSSKSKQTGAGGFMPPGWVDVKDYGAACDYENDGTPTDDGTAINAAIDAVAASDTLDTVYFPGRCYTSATITWDRTVHLRGSGIGGNQTTNGALAPGIYCADGMNVDCITAIASDKHFFYSSMQDMSIFKSGTCDTSENVCVNGSVGNCGTCNISTDTIGHGIDLNGNYPGDGFFIRNVSVWRFPQFGIHIDGGWIGGGGGLENVALWRNGHAAGLSSTADDGTGNNCGGAAATHSTTTLVDCGAFAGLDLTGQMLRVADAGGNGNQTRRILSNTDDTITISGGAGAAWRDTPADGDAYTVDFGGGLYLDTKSLTTGGVVRGLDGCQVDSVGGDGNDPSLITVYGGDASPAHSTSPGCEIYNVKSEEGTGNVQVNALRMINPGTRILISGVNHLGPADGPPIYFEGKTTPRELIYQNVGQRDSTYTIDTTGTDTATARFQVANTHEGSVMENIVVHRGAEPYACTVSLVGNRYYNTTDDAWCYCDDTPDWVRADIPATPCT